MEIVITVVEVKEMIDYYALNAGLDGFYWIDNTFTDGDIEYSITEYSNGNPRSILVRLRSDCTQSYREFFEYNYDFYEDLIYEAFSDETTEELIKIIRRKIK